MSALSQLLTKNNQIDGQVVLEKVTSKVSFKKISEGFWCCTSLLLFLALGPFAVVATVLSVASLASGQKEKMEPESAY